MVKSDKRNSQVSNLVDRYDKEALISLLPNPSASFPSSIFKPFIVFTSSNFLTRIENKNIKRLTKMMQSLVLSVWTIQTHLD